MAVEDKYGTSLLNSSGVLYRQGMPAVFQGLSVHAAYGLVTVASADDDNSIYRMFKDIPASAIPLLFPMGTSGMTGSNDWNIGLHYTGKLDGTVGSVKSENCLGDAVDFSSAIILTASTFLNGLNNIVAADRYKNLAQLAGYTTGSHPAAFDIALKAIAAGSAAGTIEGWFIYGMP